MGRGESDMRISLRTCIAVATLCMAAATANAAVGGKVDGLRHSYQPSKLASNVYVIYGPVGEPDPQNQGFRNNPAIVLTSKGAVVIDPGSSVKIGNMVAEQARKLTDKPIVAVLDTHVHGDHWLGNDGIKRAYPNAVIYGHPNMKKEISGGVGKRWIKMLNDRTNGEIAGTRPVPPDQSVGNGEIIKIGDTRFRILSPGPAHSDTDIMIFLMDQGILFTGDIVRNGMVSQLQKSTTGTLAAIDMALKTNARLYVPGHGKAGSKKIVTHWRTFVATMYESIRKYYDQGLEDYKIRPKLEKQLVAYKDWPGFKTHLGYLTSTIYREVEEDSFK
jgi:glyoxylase-like metal-dependent hydrolase (beta-lactamase superfamily II)